MKTVILFFFLLTYIVSLVGAYFRNREIEKTAPVDDVDALEQMREHFVCTDNV